RLGKTRAVRLTARNLAAAALIVAIAVGFAVWKHSWAAGAVWIVYFALLVARYHFFPPSRPLHPPSESTLHWLRQRRKAR
ncbi:MAG: hypothetical protein ACYDHT_03605, partial [Solirubrobacteraceae bacterium]